MGKNGLGMLSLNASLREWLRIALGRNPHPSATILDSHSVKEVVLRQAVW